MSMTHWKGSSEMMMSESWRCGQVRPATICSLLEDEDKQVFLLLHVLSRLACNRNLTVLLAYDIVREAARPVSRKPVAGSKKRTRKRSKEQLGAREICSPRGQRQTRRTDARKDSEPEKRERGRKVEKKCPPLTPPATE